jgi:hypothetical protein
MQNHKNDCPLSYRPVLLLDNYLEMSAGQTAKHWIEEKPFFIPKGACMPCLTQLAREHVLSVTGLLKSYANPN